MMTKIPIRLTRTAAYVTSCIVLALAPAKVAFADANQLFVTPNQSQMNVGTSFSVNIKSYADTQETTGSAIGTVTYPVSKLKVKSISINGSGYGSPSITQGSGTIGFNASRNPAPSGISQIFSVTFTALKGGTAVVGFTSSSKVNSSTTVYGTGVFTIISTTPTKPSPSPPPTKSVAPVPVISKPDPSKNTSKDDKPKTTTDPTGLIDSDVAIDALYDSATVTWKATTKKSSSMTLSYGLDNSNLDKKTSVTKKSDGSYAATLNGLEPGERYFFTISGKDGKGKEGTFSSVIYTRGYPVIFTVTENNLPAKDALVSLETISRSTDQNGKLTIGLAAGDYEGTITTDTASLKINLSVAKKDIPADGTTPESQAFSFNLKSDILDQGPGSGFSILSFLGILLAGTVALGIGFFLFITIRRRHFESDDTIIRRGPSVIIDDGYDWTHRAQQASSQSEPPEVPSPPSSQTQAAPPEPQHEETPRHDNSVYLDEEEPEDMFEKAQLTKPEESEETPIPDDKTESTYENQGIDSPNISNTEVPSGTVIDEDVTGEEGLTISHDK